MSSKPVGLLGMMRGLLRSPVPPRFQRELAFGWLVLLLFLVQVFTGILLSLYYQASPGPAADSVRFIVRDVEWGWLVRGLHHWSAYALIFLFLLRLTQIFLKGSYRGRRATGWCMGLILLWLLGISTLSGGFLRWDDDAYWRVSSVVAQLETLPWFGSSLASILRGGSEVGGPTLSRLYSAHTMFVPWLIWLLLVLNLWFLARRIGDRVGGGT